MVKFRDEKIDNFTKIKTYIFISVNTYYFLSNLAIYHLNNSANPWFYIVDV